MGYRSEVAWGIRLSTNLESDNELMKQLKSNDIDLNEQWRLFVTEAKVRSPNVFNEQEYESDIIKADHTKRYMWFKAGGLKWYPEFDGVKEHHAIMDLAREYNSGYEDNYNLPRLFDVAFVRIGEESDDIETEYDGEGYDMFYPVNYIDGDFNFSDSVKGEKP